MAEYFVKVGGVYPGFGMSMSERFCCAGIGGGLQSGCLLLSTYFFCSLSIIVDTGVILIILNKTYQAVCVTSIILKMTWLFF